jgi:hypothetical protein
MRMRRRRISVAWTEPILFEQEFAVDGSSGSVRVRLGFPRPVDAREWACAFQVSGWQGDKILFARSVDGLHALLNAATAIRRRLDEMGNVRPEPEPHELVFPRVVPMADGLDFHRHLCRMLDGEIKKRDEELAKRRQGRGGSI